ncbi:hypothetical protein BV898_12322 [Hypsibius exemplaris]|uniref:Uncharacterized protein n=1 Tax=Hypsibius exemplaris TaxID=2072580 RepID=A0A1W0WE44_HYPEX|nr:hypothetical protein BV898_12322 [Hypsibius exemplaris]
MSNPNFQYEQQQQQQQQQQREGYVQEKEQHTSYVHTEVKMPMHLAQPVFMSSSEGLAKELIGEGFHASISRFTGASKEAVIYESPKLAKEAQDDFEGKQREQEQLAQAFEKELERRTEIYRKQAEKESELIRKELEKQHMRDVEFRKELADVAIENQKKQIDIESRYAKRELDRQRQMARESLERSKFQSEIQVNLETAVGATQSGSSTVAESEAVQVQCN